MVLLGGMDMRTGRNAFRMLLKCGYATPAVEAILKHCAACGIDLDQTSAAVRPRGACNCGELRRRREKLLDDGGQACGLIVMHHVPAVLQHRFFEVAESQLAFGELRA